MIPKLKVKNLESFSCHGRKRIIIISFPVAPHAPISSLAYVEDLVIGPLIS